MRVMHHGDKRSPQPACGSGVIGGRPLRQTLDWSAVTCKRCLEQRELREREAAARAEMRS